MSTWFTADLHLGHRNIIDYCNRPFADTDAMNCALIDRWNGAVESGDTVFVLGDFALGQIADTLPLARELSGRKVLLAGNHDRCWFGHGDRSKPWVQRYIEAGFDEIIQGSSRLNVAGLEVELCHFPYEGDSRDHDRYVEFRPPDEGGLLLHGHVHDRWTRQGRMINVGVDVWDFKPVHEAVVRRELELARGESVNPTLFD